MARATTALKATGDPPPEDVQTVPAEGAWHRPAPASETTPAPNSAAAASERVSLALAPAGPRERRVALAVVLLSAVAFVAAVRSRACRWRSAGVHSGYESALAINDSITAILLFGQFPQLRSRALLRSLAGTSSTRSLSFRMRCLPGVFSATGLLGAGSRRRHGSTCSGTAASRSS